MKTSIEPIRQAMLAKSAPATKRRRGGEKIPLLQSATNVIDLIVFLCLLTVIVTAQIPYGTVDAWWEALFEGGVFAIAGLRIIGLALFPRWRFNRSNLLLPLVLLAVFAFLQTVSWPWTLWSSGGVAQHTLTIDRYQTYLTARKFLALILFTALLLEQTSSTRRLRWLVRAVIAVGLGSALFGIVRQLWQSADSQTGFVLPFLFYQVGYAQFISTNVFAFLMEMTTGLLLGLVLGGGVQGNRIPLYVAALIPVWTALVLSNSRGGLVGLLCQSLFILFTSLSWYAARDRGSRLATLIGRSLLVRVAVIILIVSSLVVAVLWMGGEDLALKLSSSSAVSQDAIEGTTRKDIWQATWSLIQANPRTGVGFGAFYLAIPQYQNSSGHTKVEQAHSDYLDLLASGGIVAVGLAAWFVFNLLKYARSSLRSNHPRRRAAALGALGGILSVAVHSTVDFGLQVTGIAVVFAALAVIAVADVKPSQPAAVLSSRWPRD